MSHFYGVLNGSRGQATRCATKKSGLEATAAGWGGSVRVMLWHDEKTGEDRFIVSQSEWHGKGIAENIAEGIIGQPVKRGER